MRIDSKKTICIAIDYQERLLPAIAELDELMKRSVFLFKGLKALGIPMIMTTQYAKGLGENAAPIADLIGAENCYDKNTFSVMGQDEVRDVLKQGGYEHVIITGTEAHICVLQSVIDLCTAGYRVYMAEDCVSSRHLHDKEIALRRAEEEGAFLTTAEALLYELMGSSKCPAFKAVSALVKEQG
ncbi:MAG: isochorismatase family protein [Eubacteriales bacterium]|nr:isochorismatase family protein [Eubacteriales bacterium]